MTDTKTPSPVSLVAVDPHPSTDSASTPLEGSPLTPCPLAFPCLLGPACRTLPSRQETRTPHVSSSPSSTPQLRLLFLLCSQVQRLASSPWSPPPGSPHPAPGPRRPLCVPGDAASPPRDTAGLTAGAANGPAPPGVRAPRARRTRPRRRRWARWGRRSLCSRCCG